jgi:hypothetical protein
MLPYTFSLLVKVNAMIYENRDKVKRGVPKGKVKS